MHADHDVFEDAQIREQAEVLKGAGDAAFEDAMRRQPQDLDAGETDRAAIGRHEAGDRVEEGRLARTVRANDGDDAVRRDAQRHRAQRNQAAKPHGQILDLE